MAEPTAGEEQRDGRPELSLVGGFRLVDALGRPLDLPTRKVKLLLAVLALPAGTPQPRERLATMFWGDRGDEQARGSLRNALVALRDVLGPDALNVTRDIVELRPGALRIDVEDLSGGTGAPPAAAAIQAALRGTLLDGMSIRSDPFAEWLDFERARCATLAAGVLRRGIEALAREGRIAEAIDLAHRLLAMDPLREESHRLLMELHLAQGERPLALARYRALQDTLRRELGVEPAAETTALAQRIAGTPPPPAPPLSRSAATDAAPMPVAAAAPSRYSVVVLPFVNGSDDPEQRFLAEGFAEDLITELSRLRDFDVIARQSSWQFSGRAEHAAEAALELGVRHAIVGSLRQVGDRLRVTAQLMDTAGRRCLWAERYDRDAADLFAVQDEIIAQVVARIDAEVRHAEREHAARSPPGQLDAWALFHRGLWHAYRFTPADTAEAEALFRRAASGWPDFALPHGGLGYAALVKALWLFGADPRATIAEGLAHASAGVARDPDSAFCQVVFGRLLVLAGDLDRALHHLELAISGSPSFAQAHFGRAHALLFAGRAAEALASIDRGLRLSPKDPLAGVFLTFRAFAYFQLGEVSAMEAAAREAGRRHPGDAWSRLALSIALVEQGRVAEAREAVAQARRIQPALTPAVFASLAGTKDTTGRRAAEALAAAGFVDTPQAGRAPA